VLAEKLVTIVARGDTTTRDRDFACELNGLTGDNLMAGRISDEPVPQAQAQRAWIVHGSNVDGYKRCPRMAA
jgi:hypothetical protein